MDGVLQNEGARLSVREGRVLPPPLLLLSRKVQREQVTLEASALELILLELI